MSEPAPETASEQGDVNEASLFYGIASQRLRRRATWAGAFLLLSFLLPHEMVETSPLFLWDTLPELPLASAVAALAMPIAGLCILLSARITRRATSLAVAILASFALTAIFYQLGGDRAAWDIFSMPDSVSTRPAPLLLALALTASGAALTFRLATRKLGHAFLLGGMASALFFYVWPTRGEAPVTSLYRSFSTLGDLPSYRFQIGALLMAFIVLWPLLIAGLGLFHIKTPAQRDNPWLSMLATFGLPSLLVMFAYRALIFAQAGVALIAYVFTILVVSGILALLSSSLLVIAQSTSLSEGEILASSDVLSPPSDRPSASKKSKRRRSNGLVLKIAAMVGTASVLALSVAEWVLARPPHKGVEWELSGATDDADAVFGPLFARWDNARRTWDSEVRHEASASARLAVKQSERELTEGAKKVDPRLADAFKDLTSESEDLDLAGRRFFRLIEEVNETSQKARLPYYIDPAISIEDTKDGVRRHYYASTFRIDSVNRWDVDGRAFATLIVRSVSGGRSGHGWLGFSRDVQPFALVDTGEIDPYRLDIQASAQTGTCSTRFFGAPGSQVAFEACAEVLAHATDEAGSELRDALVTGTERHELQHQVDGPHLTLSGPVLTRLAGYAPSYQDRVNREVSAYVAELTADGVAPRLELVHLAQFVVGEQAGTYHHAAVIVFEALAKKELRHGAEPNGEVDFREFANVLRDLAALPQDELRERARKSYRSLFGSTLLDPKRVQ